MPEVPNLSVYLAGPVSNCNEKQKTEWRRTIKSKLSKLGHIAIDPADHIEWTPFMEMVELDRSDAVIANLWRESVGTVVGIVQARRKAKPVILIDPNYLDNVVLRYIVGKEFVVRGIDEAVNLLPQVFEQFNKVVAVKKATGALEPFSCSKLHDSLNAVCARAHVEDAILPDLVANAAHRAVMRAERDGQIHADQIKLLIFDILGEIAADNLYEEELKQRATVLRRAWEEYERIKKDQRWALQHMEELEHQLKDSTDRIQLLETQKESSNLQLSDLRRTIRELERQQESAAVIVDDLPADDLIKDYANYFPNLAFDQPVLRWISSCERSVRRVIEAKFRVMNQGKVEGKHEVPGTAPLAWQQDAGHGLRIYFRHQNGNQTAVLLIGTKGTQESDYRKLKRFQD